MISNLLISNIALRKPKSDLLEILKNLWVRSRSSHRRYSVKKIFWKFSQNSQENTCKNLFFNKAPGAAQLFSCEFFEIFKNTFSKEHPWTTVSQDHFSGCSFSVTLLTTSIWNEQNSFNSWGAFRNV